ncbi:MAG: hypothetical protein ACYC2H_02800 [Thermoplasmatota archaeon]
MELMTAWQGIAIAALALPRHEKLVVPRDRVPHPKDSGLYLSIGLAQKCRHYRKALPDGRGLHVHEYADRFVVHWDAVDPSVSVLRHFFEDVTHAVSRRLRGVQVQTTAYA